MDYDIWRISVNDDRVHVYVIHGELSRSLCSRDTLTKYLERSSTALHCKKCERHAAANVQRRAALGEDWGARIAAQFEVKVGDYVRSFSFEHRHDTYVEGVVTAIVEKEGCDRYEIPVERVVWGGVHDEFKYPPGHTVYPPVNGTPRSLGGVCDGVVIVERPK